MKNRPNQNKPIKNPHKSQVYNHKGILRCFNCHIVMYEDDDDPTGYVHATKGMNPQSCMADLRQNRCRKALTENNAYPMGRPWILKSKEAKEMNKVIQKKDSRLLKKNKRAMKNLKKTKEWAEAEAGGYTL